MGQCSDSFRSCSGGGKKKTQTGGRFNTYDGFCQNEMGQCSDSFRSCSGGGNKKMQTGGEENVRKGFYGNFDYNYIDHSDTFSIPKTTFDRVSRNIGKKNVYNWINKETIRFSSPGLDKLHHLLESNIVSHLRNANMKANSRGSSRVSHKDLSL